MWNFVEKFQLFFNNSLRYFNKAVCTATSVEGGWAGAVMRKTLRQTGRRTDTLSYLKLNLSMR